MNPEQNINYSLFTHHFKKKATFTFVVSAFTLQAEPWHAEASRMPATESRRERHIPFQRIRQFIGKTTAIQEGA